jgi:hypothetical protein
MKYSVNLFKPRQFNVLIKYQLGKMYFISESSH